MTYAAKGYAIINLPFVSAVKMVIDPMVAAKLCPFTSFPAAGHTLVSIPLLNYLFHILFECLAPYPPLVLKVFFVSLFCLCMRLSLIKVRPHCVWFPTQCSIVFSLIQDNRHSMLLYGCRQMLPRLCHSSSRSPRNSVSSSFPPPKGLLQGLLFSVSDS